MGGIALDSDATYLGGSSFAQPTHIRVDGSGSLVYSTFLSADALAPSIFDIDAFENAYDAGVTDRPFPVSTDALQPCAGGGGNDIFVAPFDSDGALAAATYLGGSNIENAYAIAVTADGTVVLMGDTRSADFPVTPDSPPSPFGPPWDFVSRFYISDPANTTAPCLTLALQNGASFAEGPIAPGEVVRLRGLRRVFSDGLAAPILYARSAQVKAQVPWE